MVNFLNWDRQHTTHHQQPQKPLPTPYTPYFIPFPHTLPHTLSSSSYLLPRPSASLIGIRCETQLKANKVLIKYTVSIFANALHGKESCPYRAQADISMSPYQGPPISVDDADNIRRFIEQMGRSGTAKPTNVPVDDPPTILPTNHEDTTDTDRDMPEMSTNSSPPAAPERDTVQAYDMQSPQARGVLAPPPTPNMPLGNEDIGRMIHDQINALPSTFTLGDSKYAPKKSSLLTGARPPGVHISSSPKMPQVSTEQRRDHNLSFARMSFITSDDPPLRFPILLSKENSDKVPGIKTSESKYDSPPAVDFKAASGSSEFKDKSPSEHTTLAMPQDSEKPVSSEEGMRASAYTPPTTPPHLQAAKEPDYPVPSFPDLKIKDEPIEKPMVVLKENKLPDTHAKLASDNSMFRDMAKSQADKTVPLRREYSPSRGTLATRTAKEDETLKNALYFTSWPQSQRDKPGTDLEIDTKRLLILVLSLTCAESGSCRTAARFQPRLCHILDPRRTD